MRTHLPSNLLSALFVLSLSSLGTIATAQNILTNPGFEAGDLTGWLVAGVGGGSSITVQSGDNGPSESGTFTSFIDNQSEGSNVSLKQSTEVGTATSGTVFYSFDLKIGEAAEGGVFFVQIFAEEEGVGIVATSGLLGNFAPSDWTAYEGDFEAPEGTDFLTIELSAVTGAVSGSVSSMYVDNVSLAQEGTTDTPEMQVPGAGLLEASPNPLTSFTQLFFEMPEAGQAALTVYDQSGRRVATLLDGRIAAGSHAIPFATEGLASGTYFYELRTNARREVRKLTVLR